MDHRDFVDEISNHAGQAKAALEQIVDRNPDLPQVVRRRLMATVFRMEALSSVEQLRRMADAAGFQCGRCTAGPA